MKIVKISDMTKLADTLARSILANYAWSKKLRNAVKVGRAVQGKDTTQISIQIAPGNPDLQAMALAFERGSGLHGKRKRKYLITGKPWMAFFGTNGYGNTYGAFSPTTRKGVGEKTVVVTKQVMHPGVRKRGDIEKSIQTTLPKASDELKLSIRRNLVNGMKIMLKGIEK